MKVLNTGITLLFLLITPIFSDEESERKALDQEIEEKLKIVSAEGRYDDEDVLMLSTSITRDKRDLTASLVRLMDEKYDRNVRGRALGFLYSRGELGKPLVVDALLERLAKQMDAYYKEYNDLENPEDLTKPLYGMHIPLGEITEKQLAEMAKLPPPDESLQSVRRSAMRVGGTMSELLRGRNPKALDALVHILVEPKGLLISNFNKIDILNFAIESGNSVHLEKIRKFRKSLNLDDPEFIRLVDDSIRAIEKRFEENSSGSK